jgi:hypothetical protein
VTTTCQYRNKITYTTPMGDPRAVVVSVESAVQS